MKLKKSLFAAIALSTISTTALAHEINGTANPQHYTIYAGQQVNVHSYNNLNIKNTTDAAKHFTIVYWCWAQGMRDTSTINRSITLQPGQVYDEQNVDCYVPFKVDMHNWTAEFDGGINITPDGEAMTQMRGKNYINVY